MAPASVARSAVAFDKDEAPAMGDAMDGFVAAPARMMDTAARLGPRPAYFVRDAQGWQPTSWHDYAAQVRQAARALLALGVQRGDAVAIWSFNRPEWAVMAFAAMAVGAVPAGIYWTSSPQDVDHILNHSKAPVLVVEDLARLNQITPWLPQALNLRQVVLMTDTPQALPSKVSSWQDFMARGASQDLDAAVERCMAAIQPDDTGALIYTSGTTGPSKAVVLSHGNLSWTALALSRTTGANEHDRVLSYLPFAHIAEQMGCLHNQACTGFSVYFARSMEALGEHLKEVKPTIFFGVPRVWEKMQAAIEAKLAAATGTKAILARWALSVGRQWHEQALLGSPPGLALRWQQRLAHRLVHAKVQQALGFDQARLLISGAAPIAPDKLRFFTGLGLVVRELYGQSEACGPSTLSLAGQTRIGSVGQALPGTRIQVAPDGELLIKGPHIFKGYLHQPEATHEALKDGWLQSGDLGHIDEDGYVYITGRKKDLLITSGGKNISPGNIEAALMDAALVEHAVVCGDGRHYLTALITLDAQALGDLIERQGGTAGDDPCALPAVIAAVQLVVDQVNSQQARVAHIRKFTILRQPLTIEGGELTATMKVKRKVVIDRHQAQVEQLYQSTQDHQR